MSIGTSKAKSEQMNLRPELKINKPTLLGSLGKKNEKKAIKVNGIGMNTKILSFSKPKIKKNIPTRRKSETATEMNK